jgi:hypothetical protein
MEIDEGSFMAVAAGGGRLFPHESVELAMHCAGFVLPVIGDGFEIVLLSPSLANIILNPGNPC